MKKSKITTGEKSEPVSTRDKVQVANEVEAILGKARMPLDQEELLALCRSANRSRSAAEVAAGLGVLLKNGQAVEKDGKFSLSASRAWRSGKAVGTRSGLMFFEPDEEQGDGAEYVFDSVSERACFPGDRVLVSCRARDSRGRTEVRLCEVIEYHTQRLVGTVVKGRREWQLMPADPKVHVPVTLSAASALPGQAVVAEIIEQPSAGKPARAQVTEILGSADDASVEIEMAVRRFCLPSQFDEQTKGEAAALPQRVLRKECGKRVDLRDVPFVTIDGEDARDFDDAVWCAPLKAGGWRLLVAIADVSWYVKPGSALDRSAQQRLTSVYFPRRVIPMLPEELSNGLCSLNPGVDRCTLVCDCMVDAAGKVGAYQFYPALIHSHARLTYGQVWKALQGEEAAADSMREVLPHVEELYRLYKAFASQRRLRGAISFEGKETQVQTDEEGKICGITLREHNDAHRLIEEAMLAANTCAADFLVRRQAPGLFRIHDKPSEERLTQLRQVLLAFGLQLKGGSSPSPADYEEVMRQVRGTRNEEPVQTALLRSMQRAVYSPENRGHFGLAYGAYTHFTSPIRRYPDLLVHRAIRGILSRRRYRPKLAGPVDPSLLQDKAVRAASPSPARGDPERQAWATLGEMSSAAERRADEASLDVMAWLKCCYMRAFMGRKMAGKVSGVTPYGIYVTLDEYFVEGFVHVSNLGWDFYTFDESTCTMHGEDSGEKIRIGDPMDVRISEIDVDARRIDFVRI